MGLVLIHNGDLPFFAERIFRILFAMMVPPVPAPRIRSFFIQGALFVCENFNKCKYKYYSI